MKTGKDATVRLIVAIAVVMIAILRIVFFDVAKDRIDDKSILLFALAIVVYFVPWDRLRSLKAAGLEVSIDLPQINAAVDAIELDLVDNEKLRQKIHTLAPLLPRIRGARVLWIDDKPHDILGERRLLRALGVSITPAESSELAAHILESDDDFDLIITDVQRAGETYKDTGGIDIHEGVNFIVQLRKTDNPVIRSMPVIFYAAYDWDRLQAFTRPARLSRPEPRITNSIDELMTEAIRQLADSRTHPIKVNAKKAPTDVRWP
jgi:CheY-like chemotaxis protein